MASIKPEIGYTLRVTDWEFKLIGLALVGKLERRMVEDAKNLNLCLTRQRAEMIRTLHETSERALEHAEEFARPEPPQG